MRHIVAAFTSLARGLTATIRFWAKSLGLWWLVVLGAGMLLGTAAQCTLPTPVPGTATPTSTASPVPSGTPTAAPTFTLAHTSTAVPSATWTATATAVPPTATPTVTATPELTPGPEPTDGLPRVLWVQDDWARMDWGNDEASYTWVSNGKTRWLRGHSEYGPMGGVIQFSAPLYWSRLEPADDQYNWSYIEETLASAPNVVLDSGEVIKKPYMFAVPVIVEHIWGATECCRDMTPDWVKARAPSVVISETCNELTQQISRPNVLDQDWQDAYGDLVRDLAAHFDKNPAYPNLVGFVAGIGLANESLLAKGCDCVKYYSSSDPPGYMNQFIPWAMRLWGEAFQNKVIWFSMLGPRTGSQEIARGVESGTVGVKNNGWGADTIEDEFYTYGVLTGGRVGFSYAQTATDARRTYQVIPTGLEPGADINSAAGVYWLMMNGLSAHVRFMDLQYADESENVWKYAEQVRELTAFDLLRFARDHLDRTEADAPSAWVVFRTSTQAGSCYPSWQCWKGKSENHEFYLYELSGAPGSRSRVVYHNELVSLVPGGQVYSALVARGTQEANGQRYISLGLEDGLPWAAERAVDCGGTMAWAVTVTVANVGRDKWALEYMDCAGGWVTRTVTKTGTGTWTDVSWLLRDACWGNGLPGGADLRIDSLGDGDEVVHRVIVQPRTAALHGLATHYDPDEHAGRETRSGEMYDALAMTGAVAAERWKELKGQCLRVVAVDSGRSVTVRVNDSGWLTEPGRFSWQVHRIGRFDVAQYWPDVLGLPVVLDLPPGPFALLSPDMETVEVRGYVVECEWGNGQR